MATITTFKCGKCGKEFSFKAGLLKKESIEVPEGSNLPKDEASDFNNALSQHQKDCGGEVKFTKFGFID